MKVVLNSKVAKLGYRGDVVDVKAGYFRNYLFPNGFADAGTGARIKIANKRNENRVLQKEQVIEDAKSVIAKIKGIELNLEAKVNDKGTLFAAISEADVVAELKGVASIDLDKSFVTMEPIKELGEYKVLLRINEGTQTEIKVNVTAAK